VTIHLPNHRSMLKISFCTILSFLFIISGTSQERISLFPYWKKGDTQKLSVSEGYINYENGEINKQDVENSVVEIVVKNETDTSYLIEWTYVDYERVTKNIELEEGEEEMDTQIEEMFDDVAILFEIDESGNYKHLVNYDEILQMSKDSLLKVLQNELGEDSSEEEMEELKTVIELMLATDMMKDELERDIFNYHYYFASNFPADTTIQYDEEMENKFGGEMIPAAGEIKMFTQETDATYHIYDTKTMDSKIILSEMLRASEAIKDEKKREEFIEQIKKSGIEIVQIENYSYDYKTGWLKKYEQCRTTSGENNKRENFIRMQEIE